MAGRGLTGISCAVIDLFRVRVQCTSLFFCCVRLLVVFGHVDAGNEVEEGKSGAKVWFGGDTVNTPELFQIKDKWHVVVAVLNLGNAIVEGLQITMSGQDAAILCQDLGVEYICPIHFDGWHHFTEHGDELKKSLVGNGIAERVKWLKLGEPVQIL